MDAREAIAEARKRKAARDWSGAESILDDALARHPDHPVLLASRADLYVRLGRMGDAASLADGLLRRNPEDPYALGVLGEIAQSEGRLDDAARCFADAARHRVGPDGDWSRSRLAACLASLGRHSEAEAVCRTVLARRPDDSSWLTRLALARRRLGHADEAKRLLRRATRANPADRYAFAELLEAESEGRSPEEFDRELASILRYARGAMPELRLLRARTLERAGQLEEAGAEYERALRDDPDRPFVRKLAGFHFHRRAASERAFELLRPVFLQNPGDLFVRGVVLSILRRRGDVEAVVDLLAAAAERHPAFKPLWGMLKKARADAARAAAGNPPPPPAAATRASEAAEPELPFRIRRTKAPRRLRRGAPRAKR